MDIAAQKILLRILSIKELGEMYPMATDEEYSCSSTNDDRYICTRVIEHTGLHIAHIGPRKVVDAWLNKDDH